MTVVNAIAERPEFGPDRMAMVVVTEIGDGANPNQSHASFLSVIRKFLHKVGWGRHAKIARLRSLNS
jgi:hypothetical protein